MTLTRARRVLLAAVGIAAVAVIARPELANSLVERGDDVAEAGDAARAQSYYRRALAIEPSSSEALDRVAVAAMMAGDTRAKEDALREICDASAWRSDGSLLFDVALLQLQLRRYEAAAGAFRRLQTVAPMELFASASRVVGRRSGEPRT